MKIRKNLSNFIVLILSASISLDAGAIGRGGGGGGFHGGGGGGGFRGGGMGGGYHPAPAPRPSAPRPPMSTGPIVRNPTPPSRPPTLPSRPSTPPSRPTTSPGPVVHNPTSPVNRNPSTPIARPPVNTTRMENHVDNRGNAIRTGYDNSGNRTYRQVARPNMTVETRYQGSATRISATYNNGTRVVVQGRTGVIERPYGNNMVRTVVVNRYTNTYVVRNYSYWGGYRVYRPYWYFGVGFYSGLVVGSPYWHPVSYWWWGWHPTPWIYSPYSPWAYYFYPAYYYPTAPLFMTDLIIGGYISSYYNSLAAQNAVLQAQINSLQAQVDQMQQSQQQPPPPQTAPVITDEMKQQIAAQVQAEIEAQKNKTSVPVSDVLKNTNYNFIVSQDMAVSYVDASGAAQSCVLTTGDIFSLAQPVAGGQLTAQIIVRAAKKSENSCKIGGPALMVSVKDLETMKNEFAARTESAAKAYYKQQGKNGLPSVSNEQPTQVDNLESVDGASIKSQLDETEKAGLEEDN